MAMTVLHAMKIASNVMSLHVLNARQDSIPRVLPVLPVKKAVLSARPQDVPNALMGSH